MVGPKKQDFWLKINILKGNQCILRIWVAPVCQNLGMILENKVVQKFRKRNVFYKKWSTKLIFLNDFFFLFNFIKKKKKKLTLKVQFWHFLMSHNSSWDCFKRISSKHVDSWAKILHFRTHNL